MLCPDLSVLPPPQLQVLCLNQSSMLLTSSSPPLVLISPPCLLSKLPVLPSKPCCPAPPSPLSPSVVSSPPFSATCPLNPPILWCRRFSGSSCSFLFMEFLILEFVLLEDFSCHSLCALDCQGMLAFGLQLDFYFIFFYAPGNIRISDTLHHGPHPMCIKQTES